jgi:hypothetical protein
VGSYGDCGNHRNLRPQCKANDAEPARELYGVSFPPRSEDLVVTSRIVDQDASCSKDGLRRSGCRFDATGARHQASHSGKPEEEGVKQCEDGFVLTPLSPPSGQEHGEVRGNLAPRVVAYHQKRALLGKPLESPHF